MPSRSFGTSRALRPNVLAGSGRGAEIRDLRNDVEAAFKSAEDEIDAISLGGIILADTVVVDDVSKLPAPAGNVITLENKAYMWNGQVDIGVNRLVAVPGTVLYGHSFVRDGIVRSGAATGPLLTVPTANGNTLVKDLRLVAPTGSTLFDVSGVFPAQNTNFFGIDLDCEGDLGELAGTVIRFSNCSMTGWDAGLEIKDVLSFRMVTSSMRQASGGTGTGLNYTGTVGDSTDIVASIINVEAGGTAINGLAANGNFGAGAHGSLTSNEFTGAGTYVSGITEDDLQWAFVSNTGITNSAAVAAYSMEANAVTTPTAGQAWTKILGTTVSASARRFANTNNRATFSGGLSPKQFRADISVAVQASVNGTDAEFGLSLNGADPVAGIPLELSNNKDTVLTFFGLPGTLSDTDYVEVWCRDTTGTASITASSLRVLVSSISEGV